MGEIIKGGGRSETKGEDKGKQIVTGEGERGEGEGRPGVQGDRKKVEREDQDQDQDSLLVKRRNDNHSPGPVIRELVPSSHQRSELSNTILCIFSE